jgi:hypothetical protein
MECSQERERTSKNTQGPGHVKRVVNWPAIEKAEREKRALKRRKLRARKRRKGYQDFIKSEFEGDSVMSL